MDYTILQNDFLDINPQSSKKERIIAIVASILCVIFFIIIIVLAASGHSHLVQTCNNSETSSASDSFTETSSASDSFTETSSASDSFSETSSASEKESSVKFCTSEECIRSAADILSAMNTNENPCDNFYGYTCGRWSSQHLDHEWFPDNSDFTIIVEKITVETAKLLKRNGSADDPIPVRQSRDLFRSCVDQETRNKKGYNPIFKHLAELGLPEVPRFLNLTNTTEDIRNYTFDALKTDAAFSKLLNVQLFVDCDVERDMFDTSKNIIVCRVPQSKLFGFGSLAMSRKQYDKFMAATESKDNVVDDKLRSAGKKFMNFTITALISEKLDLPHDFQDRLSNAIDAIHEIEIILKQIIEKLRYTTDHYTAISVQNLQDKSDEIARKLGRKQKVSWKSYFYELFQGTNVSLNLRDKDKIYMYPVVERYYDIIPSLLAIELDAKIEMWAWFKAVRNLIVHTTSEASENFNNFLSAAHLNSKLSKELRCSISTNSYMDYAVTYMVADKSFMNTTKPKVERMVQDIKGAFESRVDDLTWMDNGTKRNTIQKIRAMDNLIGFPEWLQNKEQLEKYYSPLTMNADTYLDNLIEIVKFQRKQTLERLHVFNTNEWSSNPLAVNAYNYFQKNAITIPMAIVTYPFYNRGLEVLNYGSLGTILGHELTHGFDLTGSKYDHHGNFKNWWTTSTKTEFIDKALCFATQYNNFYVPEVDEYIDGIKTLGENLADNGGLHHAYLAFQNYKQNMTEELKLPGLETFTDEQLFFLSYANIWCAEEKVQILKRQLKYVHCPNRYRILGSLSNSEEFARAFNCPVGSKMNPQSKCTIW